MGRERVPWALPLLELPIGAAGHLLAWEKYEADGTWWAWVSWVQEAGGRQVHKVVQVRAASVRPLEPLEAHQQALRRGAWP
jgi:hypothetical protein